MRAFLLSTLTALVMTAGAFAVVVQGSDTQRGIGKSRARAAARRLVASDEPSRRVTRIARNEIGGHTGQSLTGTSAN